MRKCMFLATNQFNNKKLLRAAGAFSWSWTHRKSGLKYCFVLPLIHAITILFCDGKIGLIYSTSFSSIHDDMNLRISLTLSQVNFFVTSKHFFYHFHYTIFTMVTYFLRWTLLNFFSSFPDEQNQQKVRQLDRITAQWLIHQMKLRARYCGNFEFKIFLWEF